MPTRLDRSTGRAGLGSFETGFVIRTIFRQAGVADEAGRSPLLGQIQRAKNKLVFVPRFPLQPGAKYTVFLKDLRSTRTLERRSFEIPKSSSAPAELLGIYPSGDQIPENLLRIYLVFSAPMKRGDIYRFLEIRGPAGKPVELPFLEIEQELWSPDRKRLTLLLDPGRIKRGLKPREEMGPILEAGKRYELVVRGGWEDAKGNRLGKDRIKKFVAVRVDDAKPDPQRWKMESPRAGTREALKIDFQESLDFGMLQRVVNVFDAKGKPVAGRISLRQQESVWAFTPARNWRLGSYQIRVDNRLEDLCGNSIEKVFDVDVFNKTEPSHTGTETVLNFSIK